MSGIRSKNSKPEMLVRRYLHGEGFRYALHRRDLPGTPDLTFPKHRAVIFVHGCFWHSHLGCRLATIPATRPEFWKKKLDGNRARDERQVRELLLMGWRVALAWECALKGAPGQTLAGLAAFLKSDDQQVSFSLLERITEPPQHLR